MKGYKEKTRENFHSFECKNDSRYQRNLIDSCIKQNLRKIEIKNYQTDGNFIQLLQCLDNIEEVRYHSTSVRYIQPLTDAQRNKLKSFNYVLDRASDSTYESEMKQVFGDLTHFIELESLSFSVYRGQFVPNFVMDFRQNRNLKHFKIE